MAITSYAELQTAAANWLDRADLTSRIPEFIELAEARFNRVIRAPDMVTRNTSFTVDSQYETLPSGFLELIRFSISGAPNRHLEILTAEEMDEKREIHESSMEPRYIAVVGDSFEFLPTPDSTYTGLLSYYDAIDGLATTDPNWLLTSHPDIYLFGTLLEAAPYLKDDERVPLWESRLQKALSELHKMNDRKRFGPTPTARPRVVF